MSPAVGTEALEDMERALRGGGLRTRESEYNLTGIKIINISTLRLESGISQSLQCILPKISLIESQHNSEYCYQPDGYDSI